MVVGFLIIAMLARLGNVDKCSLLDQLESKTHHKCEKPENNKKMVRNEIH